MAAERLPDPCLTVLGEPSCEPRGLGSSILARARAVGDMARRVRVGYCLEARPGSLGFGMVAGIRFVGLSGMLALVRPINQRARRKGIAAEVPVRLGFRIAIVTRTTRNDTKIC